MQLAFAYMQVASDLKKRVFLGADSIIQEQIDFCIQVADLLFARASLTSHPQSGLFQQKSMRLLPKQAATTLEFFGFPQDSYAYKLAVSWTKMLQTINGNYIPGFDRGSRIENIITPTTIQTASLYDAIMPTLLGDTHGQAAVRIAHDDRSGERYLQLAIGESTYATMQALRQPENQTTRIAKVIKLALLIVSADQQVLVLQPAKAAHLDLAPSVQTNLDIPTRWFGNTDYDKYGLPDFTQAVVRATKASLNMDLDNNDILVHGIGRITTPNDYQTWVMALSYQSELVATDIMDAIKVVSNPLKRYESTTFTWLPIADLIQVDLATLTPEMGIAHHYLQRYLTRMQDNPESN